MSVGGSPVAAPWRGGPVEQAIFGTRDGAAIDAAVDGFCRARLGAGVAGILFRAASVGVVTGVRLEDGRRVVVKVHQPRESLAALDAVRRVHAHLHREGFPCPRPLAAPIPLARGHGVAEELVDAGEFRDAHDPDCRRLMAEGLAWQLDLARGCGRPAALGGRWSLYAAGRLWPREAHSPLFDLKATAAGAEWIDALAARAKARAVAGGEPVVGHHDWSAKHVRFAGERIAVVYDWDSLGLGPEAVVVGIAAMTHTVRFGVPGLRLAPAPDEVRAFVDDYDAARSARLTRSQREQIAACATFVAAYTARCEHARPGGGATSDPGSFTSALRTHAADYLRP